MTSFGYTNLNTRTSFLGYRNTSSANYMRSNGNTLARSHYNISNGNRYVSMARTETLSISGMNNPAQETGWKGILNGFLAAMLGGSSAASAAVPGATPATQTTPATQVNELKEFYGDDYTVQYRATDGTFRAKNKTTGTILTASTAKELEQLMQNDSTQPASEEEPGDADEPTES